MDWVANYIGLYIILCCIAASILAQIVKILIHFILTRQLILAKLFSTGGMPSSHSAFICCLSTLVGLYEGLGSVSFALSVCIAVIVMHDSMNVRRSVGIQAQSINNIQLLFQDISKMIQNHSMNDLPITKIKELLGHTPLEVYMGGLFGCLCGFMFNSIL